MPTIIAPLVHDNGAPRIYAFGCIATGNTFGTATANQGNRNVYTVVPSGAGCVLGGTSRAAEQVVSNYGANTLTVYPPGGWQIMNTSAVLVSSVTITSGASATFITGDPANAVWYMRI